ncbi:50S ribosomal protein L15 [bacterium]|nr:50S ribosomal protein L15 [bacterium]
MKLHELTPIVKKSKKRLGRGLSSGAGAKSGRGTTRHQKARRVIPLHFEGGQNKITHRYPLLRGKARNKVIFAKPLTINVTTLNTLEKGSTVDLNVLMEHRMVPSQALKRGVKILGRGTLSVALNIALPVSQKAQLKIEQAGGTLITA